MDLLVANGYYLRFNSLMRDYDNNFSLLSNSAANLIGGAFRIGIASTAASLPIYEYSAITGRHNYGAGFIAASEAQGFAVGAFDGWTQYRVRMNPNVASYNFLRSTSVSINGQSAVWLSSGMG